jgi:hypothetical protein
MIVIREREHLFRSRPNRARQAILVLTAAVMTSVGAAAVTGGEAADAPVLAQAE